MVRAAQFGPNVIRGFDRVGVFGSLWGWKRSLFAGHMLLSCKRFPAFGRFRALSGAGCFPNVYRRQIKAQNVLYYTRWGGVLIKCSTRSYMVGPVPFLAKRSTRREQNSISAHIPYAHGNLNSHICFHILNIGMSFKTVVIQFRYRRNGSFSDVSRYGLIAAYT